MTISQLSVNHRDKRKSRAKEPAWHRCERIDTTRSAFRTQADGALSISQDAVNTYYPTRAYGPAGIDASWLGATTISGNTASAAKIVARAGPSLGKPLENGAQFFSSPDSGSAVRELMRLAEN